MHEPNLTRDILGDDAELLRHSQKGLFRFRRPKRPARSGRLFSLVKRLLQAGGSGLFLWARSKPRSTIAR